MFHRTRDAIEAHLTIVFAALAVAREMQRRTGLSTKEILKQLRPLRSALIVINGTRQEFPPAVDDDRRRILADLSNEPGH